MKKRKERLHMVSILSGSELLQCQSCLNSFDIQSSYILLDFLSSGLGFIMKKALQTK